MYCCVKNKSYAKTATCIREAYMLQNLPNLSAYYINL